MSFNLPRRLFEHTFAFPYTAFSCSTGNRCDEDLGLILCSFPQNSKKCQDRINEFQLKYHDLKVLSFVWTMGNARRRLFMVSASHQFMLAFTQEIEKGLGPRIDLSSCFPHKMFGFTFRAMAQVDLLGTVTGIISQRGFNMIHFVAPRVESNRATYFGHFDVSAEQLPELRSLEQELGQVEDFSIEERFPATFPG